MTFKAKHAAIAAVYHWYTSGRDGAPVSDGWLGLGLGLGIGIGPLKCREGGGSLPVHSVLFGPRCGAVDARAWPCGVVHTRRFVYD